MSKKQEVDKLTDTANKPDQSHADLSAVLPQTTDVYRVYRCQSLGGDKPILFMVSLTGSKLSMSCSSSVEECEENYEQQNDLKFAPNLSTL